MTVIAERALLRYPVAFPLEEEPTSSTKQEVTSSTQPNQNIPQTVTPSGGIYNHSPPPVVPPVYNSPVPPGGHSPAPSGGHLPTPPGGHSSAGNLSPDTSNNRVPSSGNTENQQSAGNTVPSDNTGSQGSHDYDEEPRDRVAPVRSSGTHQNIIVAEVITQTLLLTLICRLTLGLTS